MLFVDFYQILHIEASMDGNRHNFTAFLSGVIILQVVLLISTGVLGYLSLGSTIVQIVTMSLEPGSGLSAAVNVSLIIGVIFTFPLVIYPVVYLAESTLLGNGTCLLVSTGD